MEQLLFFLLLLCAAHAEQQGLSGKVFTFPQASSTSYVTLSASPKQPLSALSLCMRFYSDLNRAQSLFSLNLLTQDNAFLLYKPSLSVYRLHVNAAPLNIHNLPHSTDQWNSVCWVWDSTSGLTTLWVNGKRSPRKILQPGFSLSGPPSIILGQEQDTYGGGFDQTQSFVGDITDVHLWDSAISPCEIRFYMDGNTFIPGNLLSWNNLQYNISGSVYVENSDFDKLPCY